MTLPGKVIEVPAGTRGFDTNQHVSVFAAASFRMKGFRLCIRYVPRVKAQAGDLTAGEASGILGAGLGLQVVQHVHPDSEKAGWVPTPQLGKQYGAFAAESAIEAGYKLGGSLWMDLEGVKPGTNHQDVISFGNYWLDQVGHAGYTPGCYVGFNPGLTSDQLYKNLRFEHYWGAMNLNSDQIPSVRGLQMKQLREQTLDGITYDPDTVQRDLLGGLPLMQVDMEWTP